MIRKYKRDERAPTPPGAKKVASAGGAAARAGGHPALRAALFQITNRRDVQTEITIDVARALNFVGEERHFANNTLTAFDAARTGVDTNTAVFEDRGEILPRELQRRAVFQIPDAPLGNDIFDHH